jgi:cell division protein ZapA (FtsZ GTPase activity inhibitor)
MSTRKARPRHSVTVSIAGEKHVIRSDAPPEYTRAVAAHVDHTVRSLGEAQPLEAHRRATLAALVITDELFRARDELQRLRDELEARSTALAERLERATGRPGAPAPEAAASDAPSAEA